MACTTSRLVGGPTHEQWDRRCVFQRLKSNSSSNSHGGVLILCCG